eukprot:TRINITY_DN66871_c0_g1_i1.p1 TRINITY_DN66871_c0_g1~~TRINITY_DN66871_c0_g1_i1.p1  ORF type:complete len:120 (+),score=8.32 TRINITY_DN66871_c0_g1_i1:28-360(+)
MAQHLPTLTILDLGCCPDLHDRCIRELTTRCIGLLSFRAHSCPRLSDKAMTYLSRLSSLQSLSLGRWDKITTRSLDMVLHKFPRLEQFYFEIGRAVLQECRDRSRMPSSA